jgi:hypothetical protein
VAGLTPVRMICRPEPEAKGIVGGRAREGRTEIQLRSDKVVRRKLFRVT